MELAILASLRHVWDQPSHTAEDEDGLFGWQLAATLRRFPSHQKAAAKLRIQQILMDIEFGTDTSYEATPSYILIVLCHACYDTMHACGQASYMLLFL